MSNETNPQKRVDELNQHRRPNGQFGNAPLSKSNVTVPMAHDDLDQPDAMQELKTSGAGQGGGMTRPPAPPASDSGDGKDKPNDPYSAGCYPRRRWSQAAMEADSEPTERKNWFSRTFGELREPGPSIRKMTKERNAYLKRIEDQRVEEARIKNSTASSKDLEEILWTARRDALVEGKMALDVQWNREMVADGLRRGNPEAIVEGNRSFYVRQADQEIAKRREWESMSRWQRLLSHVKDRIGY